MFSRLYWGQHFLTDVIFGMIFGIVFTFLIEWVIKLIPGKIKSFFKGNKLYLYVGVLAILIYFGLLFFEFVFGVVSRKVYKFVGVTLAMTLGYFLDEKYIHFESNQGFGIGVLKFIISSVIAIGLYVAAEMFLTFIPFVYFVVYFVITLILTTLLPLLFNKIFKCKRGVNGDCSSK
jgi:undecaprenyl-diphosphatase